MTAEAATSVGSDVLQLFEAHVRRTPRATALAVADGSVHLTYGRLGGLAQHLAGPARAPAPAPSAPGFPAAS